jgi:hypothetical protein
VAGVGVVGTTSIARIPVSSYLLTHIFKSYLLLTLSIETVLDVCLGHSSLLTTIDSVRG